MNSAIYDEKNLSFKKTKRNKIPFVIFDGEIVNALFFLHKIIIFQNGHQDKQFSWRFMRFHLFY